MVNDKSNTLDFNKPIIEWEEIKNTDLEILTNMYKQRVEVINQIKQVKMAMLLTDKIIFQKNDLSMDDIVANAKNTLYNINDQIVIYSKKVDNGPVLDGQKEIIKRHLKWGNDKINKLETFADASKIIKSIPKHLLMGKGK